jgi:hypothetical protein
MSVCAYSTWVVHSQWHGAATGRDPFGHSALPEVLQMAPTSRDAPRRPVAQPRHQHHTVGGLRQAGVPGSFPLGTWQSSHLEVAVTGEQETQERVYGVWGPAAYSWSGEERQRAAGFPIDPSGRQRVLGFPAGPAEPINLDWLRTLARPIRRHKRRDGGRGTSWFFLVGGYARVRESGAVDHRAGTE